MWFIALWRIHGIHPDRMVRLSGIRSLGTSGAGARFCNLCRNEIHARLMLMNFNFRLLHLRYRWHDSQQRTTEQLGGGFTSHCGKLKSDGWKNWEIISITSTVRNTKTLRIRFRPPLPSKTKDHPFWTVDPESHPEFHNYHTTVQKAVRNEIANGPLTHFPLKRSVLVFRTVKIFEFLKSHLQPGYRTAIGYIGYFQP